MIEKELNEAMRIYLGGGEGGGIDPLGRKERLDKQYGPRSPEIQKELDEILGKVSSIEIDWKIGKGEALLVQLVNLVQKKISWADDVVCKKMANYIAFQFR